MIIDTYTKIVLTIIAISLAFIAFSKISGTLITSAHAVGSKGSPLYVHITNAYQFK